MTNSAAPTVTVDTILDILRKRQLTARKAFDAAELVALANTAPIGTPAYVAVWSAYSRAQGALSEARGAYEVATLAMVQAGQF